MLEITNDNCNIAFCPVMNSFMAFMASMALTAFIICMPLRLLAFWVGRSYKSETKVNIEIIVTLLPAAKPSGLRTVRVVVVGGGMGHIAKNVPLSHRQKDISPKKLEDVTTPKIFSPCTSHMAKKPGVVTLPKKIETIFNFVQVNMKD